MNVSLTPRLELMIRQKVESGLYNNSSEVVREALRLMEERDRYDTLRAAIAVGESDVAHGYVHPWTRDSIEQLKSEADMADDANLPLRDDVQP